MKLAWREVSAVVQAAPSGGIGVNVAAVPKSWWMTKVALVRGDGGTDGLCPRRRRGGGARLAVPVNRVVAYSGWSWLGTRYPLTAT